MRKIIVKLFSAEKAPPLLFLTIIYLMGIIANSLTDTIKEISGFESWLVSIIGLLTLLIIMLILDPVSRFINYLIKRQGTLISNVGKPPKRYKGLIVLCSIGENISAEQAIRYHYKGLQNEYKEPVLKKCWMLTGGDVSKEAAEKLIAKLVTEHYPSDLFKIIEMSGADADNPTKVYEIVEGIFKSSVDEDIYESDIITDYTGGTKSMTAGVVMSCALPSRDLQVLKPKKYKDDGTADRNAGSEPMFVDIHFKIKKV